MSEQSDNKVTTERREIKVWFKVAKEEDFPENGGACVKYKDEQIAVFNFLRRKEWYAHDRATGAGANRAALHLAIAGRWRGRCPLSPHL